MSAIKFYAVALAVLSVLAARAGATEVELPVRMSDVAMQLNRKRAEHVKIEARDQELVITLKELSGKGGLDTHYSLDLKRYAGRTATLMIEIKADKISHGDRRVPPVLGKLFFTGIGHNIHSGRPGWQTLVFKGVRLPGNGLVKMRIVLRNFTGEVSIRNPRAKIDLARRDRVLDNDRKKKKKDRK